MPALSVGLKIYQFHRLEYCLNRAVLFLLDVFDKTVFQVSSCYVVAANLW